MATVTDSFGPNLVLCERQAADINREQYIDHGRTELGNNFTRVGTLRPMPRRRNALLAALLSPTGAR